MTHILLIVTGSIAAYKTAELIRLVKKNYTDRYQLSVILTKSATKFVSPYLLNILNGGEVYTDEDEWKGADNILHIDLARKADVIVVAPASADFIAKMAAGITDNLALSAILAMEKHIPLILCPAMNGEMWTNPITQNNLDKLQKFYPEMQVVFPIESELACGEISVGKMVEPVDIMNAVVGKFEDCSYPSIGHIVVTMGGTVEKIDPVRYISNFSSGKQGVEIVKALLPCCKKLDIICGPTAINLLEETLARNPKRAFAKVHAIESAKEMRDKVMELLPCDVLVSSAAVSDYAVKNPASSKIKKISGENETKLELVQNPDILAEIGASSMRPKIVIGFAAESDDLLKHAKDKLKRKNLDLIIANDIAGGAIFGSDNSNAVSIDRKGKVTEFGPTNKTAVAEEIRNYIATNLKK